MLPPLLTNQNVFIEITNPVHGGLGWELGTCLWSPVYSNSDRVRSKPWKLMESVVPGDIILHLVKLEREYHWYGISRVSSPLIQTSEEPNDAGQWRGNSPYQRINIEYFSRVPSSVTITSIFNRFQQQLISLLRDGSQFYVRYGAAAKLRMTQKYFVACQDKLYEIFNQISDEINFNPVFENNIYVPTQHEPQNPDFNPPGRVPTLVSRIIRDTDLSRRIKEANSWRCQICGIKVLLPNNKAYAEAHHLMPLGGDSQGPDVEENIMILCPNHHTEFDYGSIAINPVTRLVEHVDIENPFHLKELAYVRTRMGRKYILYHYEKRFKKG